MNNLFKQLCQKFSDSNDKLLEQNAELMRQNTEQKEHYAEQTKKLTDFIASQNVAPLVTNGAHGDGAEGNTSRPSQGNNTAHSRKIKVAQLHGFLRKSHKVKDFKDSGSENIKEWLIEFDEEIASHATLSCNLNLENESDALTNREYVSLLKDKLSSYARKEIQRAFESQSPPLTWLTVTKQQFRETLLRQFGDKEPDISSLSKCFGPNSFKKPKDMKVRKFFALWREQLPVCVQASNPAEYETLADLLLRCIFYIALDDPYLQQQLCNMSKSNGKITLQDLHDEAILAEAKRSDFESTTGKVNSFDPSSTVSINKTEYVPSGNRGSQRRGRGRGYTTTHLRAGCCCCRCPCHLPSPLDTTNTRPAYTGPWCQAEKDTQMLHVWCFGSY